MKYLFTRIPDMRIKLLISVAGDTWSNVPGDVVDWADDAAAAYIAAGYAEPVAPELAPDAKPTKRGR